MDLRFRPNRRRRKGRQMLVVLFGLCVLAADAAGCGAPPSDKILDLVQPVALMESLGSTIGEVSLSREAQRFEPPEQMTVYQIVPRGPVTRESMDALADQFGFGPDRKYGESWVRASGGALVFERMDDVGCYMLEGGDFIRVFEATLADTLSLGGKEKPWVVDMGGWYQAYAGGLPLVGAGSRVSAGTDMGGMVACFLFAEQSVESNYAVTIRPVEAALEDLKAGKGEVPPSMDSARAANITVEGIEICLLRAACRIGADVLQAGLLVPRAHERRNAGRLETPCL